MLYPLRLTADDLSGLSDHPPRWQIVHEGQGHVRRLSAAEASAALRQLQAAPLILGASNRGLLYAPFMGLGVIEHHAKVITLLFDVEPDSGDLRWFHSMLSLSFLYLTLKHPEILQVRLPLSWQALGEVPQLGGFDVLAQGFSCLLRRSDAPWRP
ncbi:hypothetical protein KKF91_01935 [Myxococcota bacterium]|nr:hypothetical protein [Myxococcota bacterium]